MEKVNNYIKAIKDLMQLMNLGDEDIEVAKSIYRSQNYDGFPTEPEAQFLHAQVWSVYETQLRGLNSALKDGAITEEDYWVKENEFYELAQKRERGD